MDEDRDFTHIGLKKRTKKQIAILAKVIGRKQFALIAMWTDDAWKQAREAGLVTDAMLEPEAHWVGDETKKRGEK
ncbi:MAG: hypothetical protein EHM40_03375 [Chloroflexi bacterium]|nr:MAG: hypothetical protein EHM40_03375 [Chloroflexota bacterium]